MNEKQLYTVCIEAYHDKTDRKWLMCFVAMAESKEKANLMVQDGYDLSGMTVLSVVVSERQQPWAFTRAKEII